MCLYPRLIKNPKYKENKKNGGIIPSFLDNRVLYVPISCGGCKECCEKKGKMWRTRLMEDIKENTDGKFITLTFSNEWYIKLKDECTKTGYELDNEIATLATRRFLERWRKIYKKSIRHWLITELGHNGTENIHLHGIIWSKDITRLKEIWKYGYVWDGKIVKGKKINYVSERTINYIIKYVTKKDIKHKQYKPIILSSAGIGSNYMKSYNSKLNKYKPNDTKENYTLKNGYKTALPIYWRNKIYSEEERELLWIEKLNKMERFVLGKKIDVSNGYEEYWKALEEARYINFKDGYTKGDIDKDKKAYEDALRIIMQEKRRAAPLLTLGADAPQPQRN